MAALWAAAAWHRLRVVDQAVVGSDSLGPYLQAQAALFGHLPRPPNPESGDALWAAAVPIVAMADSLTDAFTIRFIAGALVAPIGFAAAYHWTSERCSMARRWAAGLAAGGILAFDPGLLDTLVSGARSYGAPELVGVLTLALALGLRGVPWAPGVAMVGIAAAAGHHPLAIGVALGILPFAARLHRVHGGRVLRTALLIGGIAVLPRLLRLIDLAACGEGPSACIAAVARSNVVDPEPWSRLIAVALHDRFAVDFNGSLAVVVVGLVLALFCRQRDHRWAVGFAALALAGILGVGLVNGYVRSYHLRIVAVPVAVATALGLARVWPLAIVATAAFVHTQVDQLPVGPDPGALSRHDAVASALPPGPLWVDRVWWSGPPTLDASAVVLSGWLNDRRDFRLGPSTPFVLLSVTDDAGEPSVVSFATASEARDWVTERGASPHQIGGAYDWATIAHPETRLEDARW